MIVNLNRNNYSNITTIKNKKKTGNKYKEELNLGEGLNYKFSAVTKVLKKFQFPVLFKKFIYPYPQFQN